MSQRHRIFSLPAVAILCLAAGLLLAASFDWTGDGRAEPEPATASGQETVLHELQSTQKAFTEISRRITPAVVSISAEKVVKSPHEGMEQSPFFEGPFEEFFKRYKPPEGEYKSEGLGSGFIVRADGYILTNNHVVEGAEAIRVTLMNNASYDAEVIGTDPTTDVAVIKIEGEDFPTAPLGNSDAVEVGEWVLAIGNPMRLSFTVTAGIVSAMGRNINIIPGSYSIENFIQTDAAINPGNSGGPLVDLNGEVIGINSAISTRTGFYQGYGFAIPVTLASRIMEDLIEYKRVIRPILGIQIRNVTPELAEALGLADPIGVLVEDFASGKSPAREAGVERRDVVVRVDDIPVRQTNELQSLIARHHPGDVVTLGVVRDRKEKEIRVELAERPEGAEIASRAPTAPSRVTGRFGLDVESVPDELADELGIDHGAGVVATRVDPASPAAKASPFPVRRGDVILEMGKSHRITSPREFDDVVQGFDPGDRVLLYIARAGGGQTSKMYTSIKVPE